VHPSGGCRLRPGELGRIEMSRPVALAVLVIAGSYAIPARAGCVSDCKDEYEDAVEDCSMENDEPADAANLKLCVDEAKDEYKSCVEECRS